MTTTTLTLLLIFLFFSTKTSMAASPPTTSHQNMTKYVNITYHGGPVITSKITVHIIWYGSWPTSHKNIIRDFINSICTPGHFTPSVSGWWKTIQQYTDQSGSNVSGTVHLGKEVNDPFMSQGRNHTVDLMERVLKAAMAKRNPLPVDPTGGVYLILTASEVHFEKFCEQTCGYHTFLSDVGPMLPYAWVGYSGKHCHDLCAFEFGDINPQSGKALKPPNGDVGIDGMVNVIARQLLGVVTNPFFNGWYNSYGFVPADVGVVCGGAFGAGYSKDNVGHVMRGSDGAAYNMYGLRGRYLVQAVWDHVRNCCVGANGECV